MQRLWKILEIQKQVLISKINSWLTPKKAKAVDNTAKNLNFQSMLKAEVGREITNHQLCLSKNGSLSSNLQQHKQRQRFVTEAARMKTEVWEAAEVATDRAERQRRGPFTRLRRHSFEQQRDSCICLQRGVYYCVWRVVIWRKKLTTTWATRKN